MSLAAFRLPTMNPAGSHMGRSGGLGAFQHRDMGGGLAEPDATIGAVAPSAQEQSPQMQQMLQRYSLMTPEQMQEMSVRYRNTAYAPIIQRVLRQKQIQSAAPPPAQNADQQAPVADTPVQMRPIGGAVKPIAPDENFFMDVSSPATASSANLTSAGLNALSLLPGFGTATSAINLGRGISQGYDSAMHPDSSTALVLGGDNTPQSQPTNPTVAGSQFLGNTVYGTGLSGWLGRQIGGLGAAATGLFNTPDIQALPTGDMTDWEKEALAQGDTPSVQVTPKNVTSTREPSAATGSISAPSIDISEKTPSGAERTASSGGGGTYQSSFPDPSTFSASGNMLDTFMTGANEFGDGGRWGGFGGGAYSDFYGPNPPQNSARGGRIHPRAKGGGVAAYDVGGDVSLGEGSPWWTKQEAGSINRGSGFLKGSTLGRADAVQTTAPGGSYIIPADVVAGMGAGNSLAGARVMEEVLASGPWGTQKQRITASNRAPHVTAKMPENSVLLAKGGAAEARASGRQVPVLLSHGEYQISPADVTRIGHGSLKRGHKILDFFVTHQRAKHIATLKKLPGPVKS